MKKTAMKCFLRCCRILFRLDAARMTVIIFLSITAGFLPSLSVVIMQTIINSVQKPDSTIEYLLLFIGFYILADIASSIITRIITYESFVVERKSSISVSLSILEKTKELELSDYEDMNTYDLIQRAQNESNGRVFGFFINHLAVLQALITIISNFIVIRGLNLSIIFLLMLTTIVRTIFLVFIGKKKHQIQKERTHKERERWYYQYLLTNDIAFKEIKIYDLYNYFIQKFQGLSNIFFEQDRKLMKKQNLFETIFTLIDCIISGIVFSLLVISCKVGKILVGDVVAYMRSMSNIKSNIESFCMQIVVIWENSLFISHLFELLDMRPKEGIEDKNIEHGDIDGISTIEFINVNYKYEGAEDYVLKNINITFQKDELSCLVGKNGSGKSTLVKLISGYYDNYEGTILIDGVNLRMIEKKSFRKKIGILFQDFVRYELPLRENVTLSDLNKYSNDKDINDILRSVGFSGYNSLDMQLGYWFDNGHQLSGGEWLKIALARAFAKDSDAYILDEPNAALDPLAEKEILEYFKRLVNQKIGIIVTHKISAVVREKGRIIVMNKGEIVDAGTHDTLRESCPLYAELFRSERMRL